MKQKLFFFIGPVYCGKGTQSKKLAELTGYLHISTGDLCRAEIAKQSELGIRIKDLISKGILVPDEDIYVLISAFIAANPQAEGFILDGFPRTNEQVDYMFDVLAIEHNLDVIGGIEFYFPEEAILKRFALISENTPSDRQGRTDDNDTVIKERIKHYENVGLKVARHLLTRKETHKKFELFTIEADHPVEKVWQDVQDQWKKVEPKH